MPFILDAAFDAALNRICDTVENFYLTTQEAANFTEASSTYKCGTKAAPSIGAAANRTPNGRERVVAAITDGVVNSTATASHWALTDDSLSELASTGALASSQLVTTGNPFTTTAFAVGFGDAT